MEAELNDYGRDLTGCVGIVKPRSFTLPAKPTIKQLSFKIESGPGCSPEPGKRTVKGYWLSDNARDTLSSYDFAYALDKDGKRINRLPEEVLDVQPVQLLPTVQEKPIVVKRKK